MSMFKARQHNGYANVAWLIAKWIKRKGVGSQRESMICCGQFIIRMARKMSLLTDEVLDGLSAPVYCRSLDATNLRELIGSNGRIGNIEIRQGVLERMSHMQQYHTNRYAGVFEYMAGQYNIPLQGAYAPPGAPVYCQSLDATTLRELIGSNGRLVADDLAPGVLCVAMPRPPRPTIQDLYDRMGNIEIRQGVLERMSHMQQYHTNRCDSTGDLYPVTSPSYPQAFLVGQQTWHQRLGHPGSEVLRSLVSNNLISCNKTQSSVLCHACQLGKHVRLPFSLSETIVKAPFDIIHSDLWTSPITSVSGIKYYVLFLDHFSHYLWVYPLRHKSDVLSKFIHFRAYVKNHFNCDIKSLQCDHGGEFDNTALHQLFVTNGISIRFSCPKTSQQNGKSERMIRTINNMIRTLLFQAHLPPTFWVEALHGAYLLNFLPSTPSNEIPHTRLFNTTPKLCGSSYFCCLLD
ncbi:ribonuclease H-like domain-containing protein [Tanacetum coccineum]